jgi:predicted dehydrogenase
MVDCKIFCGGWTDRTFRTSGWAQHRRFGIGSLRDVGIYPLALLACFFGRATSVTASSIVMEDDTDVMNVDGWMLRVTFANGVMANITSSMSLSAPSGRQAYGMTIRGDDGTIAMDAMWNNDTKITFIPERGATISNIFSSSSSAAAAASAAASASASASAVVGRPMVWSTFRPPFKVTHGIGHPHVCDWSAGIEMMVGRILRGDGR